MHPKKIICAALCLSVLFVGCRRNVDVDYGGGEKEGKAASVDACSWFTEKDAEEMFSGAVTQTSSPVKGSILGDCIYVSEAGASASVTARSATEYAKTVESYKEGSEEVPDVGRPAVWSPKIGLLVQLNDVYMAQVLVNNEGLNKELSIQVAKIVLQNIS